MQTKVETRKQRHLSPLRYPGGKACLANFFDGVLKKNQLYDTTFVEPYAGGAGAALTLLLSEKVSRIVINDLDNAIFSFWKSVLDRTEELIERIEKTPVTIAEWWKQKEIYKDRSASLIDMGFATFFLNRTNRSGILDAWPIGGLEQRGNWKIDARYNKKTLVERIVRIAHYKDRITVSNSDGIQLVKEIKDFPNQLIYLDPPYFEKGSSLYLNHYIDSNHAKLANLLNTRSDDHWILTYDNVAPIKNLYLHRRQVEFPISYSVARKRKVSEVMVFSDSLVV